MSTFVSLDVFVVRLHVHADQCGIASGAAGLRKEAWKMKEETGRKLGEM